MSDPTSPTTEVAIESDDQLVVGLLDQQYGRLETGEARAILETKYGDVWNEDEFTALFEITSRAPPYVDVLTKDSNRHGTAMFLDKPRFYFLLHLDPETNHE